MLKFCKKNLGILGDRESEREGCMKNWCFGRNAAIFLETIRIRHKVTGLYVSFNISLSHSKSLKVIANRIR